MYISRSRERLLIIGTLAFFFLPLCALVGTIFMGLGFVNQDALIWHQTPLAERGVAPRYSSLHIFIGGAVATWYLWKYLTKRYANGLTVNTTGGNWYAIAALALFAFCVCPTNESINQLLFTDYHLRTPADTTHPFIQYEYLLTPLRFSRTMSFIGALGLLTRIPFMPFVVFTVGLHLIATFESSQGEKEKTVTNKEDTHYTPHDESCWYPEENVTESPPNIPSEEKLGSQKTTQTNAKQEENLPPKIRSLQEITKSFKQKHKEKQ